MKKILSFVLCLLILLGSLPVFVFAQQTDRVPIIHIYGFMSCPIYSADGQTRLFPMEKDAVVGFVKKLLPSVSAFVVNKNWTKFGDRLIPALNDLLMPIANDELGVPRNGTGVQFAYPTPQEIAASETIRFNYDWRDDPFVSAAQLRDFIDYVTDACGCDRVSLECHSYAGVVTLTYLATYGTEKVQSVCFNATAVYGAAFAGELMNGKVNMSTDALTAFLEGLVDHTEYESLLLAVVSLFDDLGGAKFLCNFLNGLFVHLSDRIWEDSILPVFNNWLSAWAMVPDAKLQGAYDFTRATVRSADTPENRIFFDKVDRFNREIRQKREACLREVDAHCNLYVIARYGYPGVPLEATWQANTDGVLNTESESFGATCEPFSFFSPTFEPHKLISPSGAIDASTCLFPQQTWFVRNYKHTQKDPSMEEFTQTLLRSPSQLTIDSLEAYPQFLYYDKVLRELYADINQVDTTVTKWYQDLFRLIRTLFERWLQRIRTPKRRASPEVYEILVA